jgi:hypothetical protein
MDTMSDDQTIAPETSLKSEAAATEDKQGFTGLIRQHPGLAVAGGLIIGLAAAALIPGSTRRKLVRSTAAAAAAAGEAGMKLGKQGAAKLEELGEAIGEGTGEARRRVADATDQARDTGLDWAKAALGLLAALRR